MKSPCSPFDMVLFGGTGDLVIRKLLPALYHLHDGKKLPEGRIICLGRSQPDTRAYLAQIEPKVRGYLEGYFSTEKKFHFFFRKLKT